MSIFEKDKSLDTSEKKLAYCAEMLAKVLTEERLEEAKTVWPFETWSMANNWITMINGSSNKSCPCIGYVERHSFLACKACWRPLKHNEDGCLNCN